MVHQINVSGGGVPKLPVAGRVYVSSDGLDATTRTTSATTGDRFRPCVCTPLEVIEALQREGHPISPGSAGENVTIAELDWASLARGQRLRIGEDLVAEITVPAAPCAKNAPWFIDRYYYRMDGELHSGWNRWYARVVSPGHNAVGDQIVLEAPVGEPAS